MGSTDFGWVLRELKAHPGAGMKQFRRRGWNGKGMWITLQFPDAHSKMTKPYIYMKTAQGDLIPWLASQADMLADDWEEAD